MISVSVIIPTYNRENIVLNSIESALSQKGAGSEFELSEIIVVDDCSKDNTEKVIEDYIRENNLSLIKYVKLQENGGASVARNEGAKLAKGDYIAFLDSDDVWYEDKLCKQCGYAEEHPEYDLIYGRIRSEFYDGTLVVVPHENEDLANLEGKMTDSLLVRNVIGTPVVLVKREAFIAEGGFFEELRALEDWEFAIRFSQKHQIGFVDEILMEAKMLEGGVSNNIANYYDARCHIVGKYMKEFREYGVFDSVVQDIFVRAQKRGVLQEVGMILEKYISLYQS